MLPNSFSFGFRQIYLLLKFHNMRVWIKNFSSGLGGMTVANRWECTVCGYIYDPKEGDSSRGVKTGTVFEDLPEGWVCPVCGVSKDMFKKIED